MQIVIRNFPEELHRDLKIVAAKTGLTMKSVIIKAIEELVRKQEMKERQGEK